MDLERQKMMRDSIIAKKCSSYPCVKKDIDGNAWCVIAPGIALFMTDLYGKDKEPTANKFVKDYPELCENAIRGQAWIREQEERKNNINNKKIKLMKERWG